VASQPRELTAGSSLGQHFLEHVTTDNYVTPGMPGTLEFFVYHSWSFIDGSVNGYFKGLDLLDSFGFNDVGIAITEFGPTWEFNLFDQPQENRHGAAFVAQTYADIAQRCAQEKRRFPITYAWWVLSDVFEEDKYREDDPFIGCMGLTSRQNIHKPAYNVYHFLAQMGTEQVPLTVTGAGNAGGMAARDADGGVQILIYNAQGPGQGPTDDVYYAVTDAQSIGVTVGGLDANKPYDVTAYRVDEAHGNAYAKWEEMNRPTMTNMTEENWQTLRDNMDSPAEAIAQSMCGGTFSQSFSLSSPGVLFIKLTPTPPKPIAQ
jgi:beta-xylosidase